MMKCIIAGVAAALLISSASWASSQDKGIHFTPLGEPGCGGALVSVEVDPHDHQHLISGGDMLGVAVSFDGGDSWSATYGFRTYEMATPTFDPDAPNVVWIGSCSGPYVSANRGIHWVNKREGMPGSIPGKYSAVVEKILFDPFTPKRLLAFGGSSRRWDTHPDAFGWVWESTDGGENWSHLITLTSDGPKPADDSPGINIVWAAYRPNSKTSLDALLDGGAWMHSGDGGRSWSHVQANGIQGRIEFLTFDPTDASIVYAATSKSGRSARHQSARH